MYAILYLFVRLLFPVVSVSLSFFAVLFKDCKIKESQPFGQNPYVLASLFSELRCKGIT